MARLKITDDLILKAHTAQDGRVWFLDGDRMPENSGQTAAQFSEGHPAVLRSEKVRVMGVPGNADLLMHLFNRKLHGDLTSLEVCSPLACETSTRREKPEYVLFDMRKWAGRPSVGGWHEFETADYPSYALAASLAARADASHMVRFLKDHPAWYALAGVPHLSREAVCKLIGTVLDPRFFIDVQDPDRLSKLEGFLGLDPKVAVVGGRTGEPVRQHDRYRTVLACWKNDDPGKDEAATMAELFVWKAYYDAGGGWKGDLRASQRLVHYLRHVWLDALYRDKPWVEPLFVPEHFFGGDRGAVNWYNRQLKRKR